MPSREPRSIVHCERPAFSSGTGGSLRRNGQGLWVLWGEHANTARRQNYGLINSVVQDEQLYVSDPRALQIILVKEQDAYEETAVFVE
jgi:hypothetical protein